MSSHPASIFSDGHHPDALVVAAFVDGTLAGDARTQLLQHLEVCATCREEVREVRRLMRASSSSPSSRVWPWGALLAAAATLLVWVAPSYMPRTASSADSAQEATMPSLLDTPMSDRERADSSVPELDAPLAVITDSLAARTASVSLTWHAAGDGATYDVVVQDETGGVRYNSTTSDTTHTVSRTKLGASGRLYWRVHAHLLDGRERSSGAHLLVVP
jgi:anti-sigma factor RsiW